MREESPARTRFKQADITRALKAARRAGLQVVSTEIKPDGTLRLVYAGDGPATAGNEWDEVLQ